MAIGVKELQEYRKDFVPLSRKNAILAYCADCMGLYTDGLRDCNNINCPLYPHQPYNSLGKK
jgi:hypothetical protein